jgi:hypothetical protein
MALPTADAGLDGHTGAHREWDCWALRGDSPDNFVSRNEWIDDVPGVTLPDLDVRS